METSVVRVRVSDIRPSHQNLKEWMEDERNVYIGRGGVVFIDGKRYPEKASIWANPFKVGESREKCIALYRDYIKRKIRDGEITNTQLEGLRGKRLGCWCKPEACHGDVLLELLSSSL